MIWDGKRSPCAETPTSIENIYAPKEPIGPKALVIVAKFCRVEIAAVQSQFDRSPARKPNRSPSENLLIAVKLKKTLEYFEHSFGKPERWRLTIAVQA